MTIAHRIKHDLQRLGPVAVAAVMLGLLGYWQFNLRDRIGAATTPESQEVLAIEVSRLITTSDGLRAQLSDLTQREYALASALTDRQSAEKSLKEQQHQADILNGATVVTGPGIRIFVGQTMTISQQIDILNALNNIGAEAVAVNGHRVTWQYSPWDTEPKAPFAIEVIGSPAALESALKRRGGVIDQLESTTGLLDIQIEQADSLTLPAGQAQSIVYGQAVE
jgi:uncharacterized protein YlxW (UPF0749 family)